MRFSRQSCLLTLLSAVRTSYFTHGRVNDAKRALQTSRRLAINRITGYMPTFDVSDLAAIDQDQQEMEELVLSRKLTNAKLMYLNGGHSSSYASLTLIGLKGEGAIQKDSYVWGQNDDGTQITGKILDDVSWTSGLTNVTIRVLYDIDTSYTPHCQVGALAVVSAGLLEFCFTKANVVKIGSPGTTFALAKSYNYTYNIHKENLNLRSLHGLAMETSTFRGMKDFDIFVQYYGDVDYADRWIMAAADGGTTSYTSGLGNADFSVTVGRLVRGEALLKGSVFLSLYMYTIGKLELGVKACQAQENNISSLALDEALAVYSGSLADHSEDGSTGLFMYGLANSKALNFKTAGHLGDHDTGTAFVNVRIVDYFKQIQILFNSGNVTQCEDAASITAKIANLMKVPIIQSVLSYAYILDKSIAQDDGELDKAQGKGATYSAAILPYMYQCNPKKAEIVYNNMRIGSEFNKVDFLAVKSAIESEYDCLGVTCYDVGGIWDGTGYSQDASPCGLSSGKKTMGGGSIFGITVAVVLFTFILIRFRKRTIWRRSGGKSSEEMSLGTIAAVSEIS